MNKNRHPPLITKEKKESEIGNQSFFETIGEGGRSKCFHCSVSFCKRHAGLRVDMMEDKTDEDGCED